MLRCVMAATATWRPQAEKIMLEHLDPIEGSLQLDQGNGEADLEAIFRA